jgi:small subunit ribosomal protein S5
MRSYSNKPQEKEFDEKVIQVSRVSKKTKGGNKVGFSVLMVVGDKKGKVGVGLGKAGDVLTAIRKGIKKAKKKLIDIPLDGTTIPFPMVVKKGAAQIMLKPAPKGSGVIAGGPVRAVVEAAGVRDISSKIMGTSNQASNVYATFEALGQIKKLVELKNIKLRSIADIEAEEEAKIKELQEKAKKTADEKPATSEKKVAPKAAEKTTAPKKVVSKKPAVKKSAEAKKVETKAVKSVAKK